MRAWEFHFRAGRRGGCVLGAWGWGRGPLNREAARTHARSRSLERSGLTLEVVVMDGREVGSGRPGILALGLSPRLLCHGTGRLHDAETAESTTFVKNHPRRTRYNESRRPS